MYACMCACIYADMYTCGCIMMSMLSIYEWYVCMYVFMYTYVCMYVCINICSYARIYAYMLRDIYDVGMEC